MNDSLSDSQALPQGTHLHEFVIERVLGSGGFGITYLARDTSLGRQVVIKENLPTQFAWRETSTGTVRPRHSSGSDTDDYQWSMQNFLREAETLASLDHPGIVRVLRKFETNGTAYFVMPFVEGVALDELIEDRQSKNKSFSEEELRGLLERMLDALGYLHERGIYHRDIKPANILITMEGIPTLIDFGSARQRLSERSMTVIESAGYTPFEQLQSRGNVGPWSDLYALGATLCKAITGETPPKAADRVMDDPWPGLSVNNRISSHYSAAFLSSIERALEPSPHDRWQNARQWQHQIESSITETPISEANRSSANVTRTSEVSMSEPATGNPPVAPALWNPIVAVNLSVLFGLPLGTYLQARNAKSLGNTKNHKIGMRWFYAACASTGITILLALKFDYFKAMYFPFLVLWYYFYAKNKSNT